MSRSGQRTSAAASILHLLSSPYSYSHSLRRFAEALDSEYGPLLNVLEMIRRELRWSFKDPRVPTLPLIPRTTDAAQQNELFELLTGETDKTLRPGLQITGTCMKVEENGARFKFDNGLGGFVHVRNVADYRVEDLLMSKEIVVGDAKTLVVMEVKKEHLSMDLCMRPSDFAKKHDGQVDTQRFPEQAGDVWYKPVTLLKDDAFVDIKAAFEDFEELCGKRPVNPNPSKDGSSAGGSALAGKKRGPKKRACQHPNFRNLNYAKVKKELDDMGEEAAGVALIHPSSRHEDVLSLTWCLAPGKYKNVEVHEEDKATETAIGRKLSIKSRVGTEVYEDLDELFARYVDTLNNLLAEAAEHPRYRDKDMDEVDKELRVAKSQNQNSIPYFLNVDQDNLGYFVLRFMPSTKIKQYSVHLTANGFAIPQIMDTSVDKNGKVKTPVCSMSMDHLFNHFKKRYVAMQKEEEKKKVEALNPKPVPPTAPVGMDMGQMAAAAAAAMGGMYGMPMPQPPPPMQVYQQQQHMQPPPQFHQPPPQMQYQQPPPQMQFQQPPPMGGFQGGAPPMQMGGFNGGNGGAPPPGQQQQGGFDGAPPSQDALGRGRGRGNVSNLPAWMNSQ